jgi:hypothetical protein
LELARVHGRIREVGVQPTHMHLCPLSIHVPVAFAELASCVSFRTSHCSRVMSAASSISR